MAYLSFSDYQSSGGELTSAVFDRYEYQAEAHINRLTHDRVKAETSVRDCVKRLTFELVEYLYKVSEAQAGLKSASNGAESATYATESEIRGRIDQLARDYLSGEVTADGYDIPLLYAGVVI